jgi:hypothetical protein
MCIRDSIVTFKIKVGSYDMSRVWERKFREEAIEVGHFDDYEHKELFKYGRRVFDNYLLRKGCL